MSLKNLDQANGKWVIHGERKQCVIGRDSFKLANMMSLFFVGEGQAWQTKALQWIDLNQQLLGEHVVLRVFGETGGWPSIEDGKGMFGSPPRDAGIWNLEELRQIVAEDRKLRRLTDINVKVIDWLMKTSHETGVCFEYVVDATLKHTEGLTTPITDNAIRLTAAYMRELWLEKYPNAVIIVEARNEWKAHNLMKTRLNEVNMWPQRFHRWKHEDGRTKIQRTDPGGGFVAEQWPEGYIIEDESMGGTFSFDCGTEAGTFDMGCIHPSRDGAWWNLPANMSQLRTDCRGAPLGFNESMLCCDKDDRERCLDWYGAGGWTDNLNQYLQWLGNARAADGVDYFIIHDEKGMQCAVNWPRAETRLEAALGGVGPLPPPGPEPEAKVNYRPIISMAYRDILGRKQNSDGTHGDKGGLDSKNEKMANGMTEAQMREEMIRSDEYAKKHPEW